MPGWRNWQTRTLEVRVEQSLEVQVLSRAQDEGVDMAREMNSGHLKKTINGGWAISTDGLYDYSIKNPSLVANLTEGRLVSFTFDPATREVLSLTPWTVHPVESTDVGWRNPAERR